MAVVKFARWIVALAVAASVVTVVGDGNPPGFPDQVRSPKEWLAQESISLLRDYVRIPTRSEFEGEEAGALFLKEFFDCANIEARLSVRLPGAATSWRGSRTAARWGAAPTQPCRCR
jgi:hypothetical protein